MKKTVKMPALTDTMESGRLVRWLKQEGDEVQPGDSLAEIETDKAVMDLEAFESGYLVDPLAAEDQDYPVGKTLASITDEPPAGKEESEKQVPERADQNEAAQEAEEQETETAEKAEAGKKHQEKAAAEQTEASKTEAETQQAKEQKSTKAAKSRAGGEQAAAGSAVLQRALAHHPGAAPRAQVSLPTADLDAGPAYEIEPLTGLRKVIAGSVTATVQTPQFRVSTRIDLKPLRDYVGQQAFSFSAMLAKACALTIQDHPDFNAAWTPQGLARREQVDVAIAMDTEHGLNTPVLRDAPCVRIVVCAAALRINWQELIVKQEKLLK